MSDAKNPNRRDFLRGGTAAAAGLALAGGLNVARMAHAAGGEELKVALIGCGGRGTGAAAQILSAPGPIKLWAVADVFAERAESSLISLERGMKERYDREAFDTLADRIDVPPERRFVGFDAYQQAIDSGVDIVLLTAPPGFRPIHYAAAVAAGKHVFMEKPCCVDAPGFRSLMETNKIVDEKDLKVVVGMQRRYHDKYVDGIKKIHDGGIGDLILLQGYWNGGPIWFRDREPEMTEMEFQLHNWNHFVWLSGDHICEQHVHSLDVCNWIKNAHPVEANGMGSCLARYRDRDPKKGMGQIFDNHFVEFTYKDGSKMYSQCRQMPGTWSKIQELAFGTKGKWKTPNRPPSVNPYQQEQNVLVEAIRKNLKHNDGWFGATSSFTGVLGRMATYSGKVVKWDAAAARGPDEMPKRFAFDADPPALPDKDGRYRIPMPGEYIPYETDSDA